VPSQVEHEKTLIDAAAGAGVRRVVKLSALGAEVGSPVAFWDWHGRTEDHLRASGVPAVVLRPAYFMTNLLGAAREALVGAGMPEFVAGQLVGMFGALRAGAHDTTTDAVRVLGGRKPRGFAEFARDHAEAFGA
jgi:uncharacterized protein YbjT (DUF2867 family)